MYVVESSFFKKCMITPLHTVYEQMSWIDKKGEELEIIESNYQKRHEEEFVNYLLTVKDFSLEAMKDFKTTLVKTYRKDFFPNTPANNGTLSAEKLQEICRMYQLVLTDREDTATRRKLYTIERRPG